MIELRGGLDLAEEALGAQRGRQLGAQYFDGHLALVFQVTSEVDRGHAAGAEFVLDGVAVRECCGESLYRITHLTSSACICLHLRKSAAPSSRSMV